MIQLTEDKAKAYLAGLGLPVPHGEVAETAEAAAEAVGRLGPSAVKALVPAGRRGKAGLVKLIVNAAEARAAGADILGREVAGFRVSRLYVETKASIERELYLAFAFDGDRPSVIATLQGGVDIEEVHAREPHAIVRRPIDPVAGLRIWEAVTLWDDAGAPSADLQVLGRVTVRLWDAFRSADALILEINPLALDGKGGCSLVGAMLGIDQNALFRQPQWLGEAESQVTGGRTPTAGELAVAEANRMLPGGAVRYTELAGDIGLLVGGGGASLLVHDMIVDRGGQPANHTDSSPGPITEKLKVMLREVLKRPQTRALLLAYNRLQMARCDVKIDALADALRTTGIDPRKFPIVVRLVGPEEARARELAAEFPGIEYLEEAASLDDAVNRIMERVRSSSSAELVA